MTACGTLNREGVVAPQDGGSVVVRQGAPFVINLSADPTTGYGWMLTNDPGSAVWLIGGPDYTPDPIPRRPHGVWRDDHLSLPCPGARAPPSSNSPFAAPGKRTSPLPRLSAMT